MLRGLKGGRASRAVSPAIRRARNRRVRCRPHSGQPQKRVTVNVDDDLGAEAEAIANERDMSVSQFYAEAVAKAIRKHERQQALQGIEEEVLEHGAEVSREAFDEAHHEMRRDDPNRTESTDSAGACDTRSIRNSSSSSSTIPVRQSGPPGVIFAVEPSSELWPARFYLSCAATPSLVVLLRRE